MATTPNEEIAAVYVDLNAQELEQLSGRAEKFGITLEAYVWFAFALNFEIFPKKVYFETASDVL